MKEINEIEDSRALDSREEKIAADESDGDAIAVVHELEQGLQTPAKTYAVNEIEIKENTAIAVKESFNDDEATKEDRFPNSKDKKKGKSTSNEPVKKDSEPLDEVKIPLDDSEEERQVKA